MAPNSNDLHPLSQNISHSGFNRFIEYAMNLDKHMSRLIEDVMNLDTQKDP